MRVNRKFKVLSKDKLLRRNLAKILIGYIKKNIEVNLNTKLSRIRPNQEIIDKIRYIKDNEIEKYKSVFAFMTHEARRIIVKKQTDIPRDLLLVYMIKRKYGQRYGKLYFTDRLFNMLESSKIPIHARLIKAKNYHKCKNVHR